MSLRVKVRPYKLGSKGARILASTLSKVLGRRVLRTVKDKFLRGRTVINWGNQSKAIGWKAGVNYPEYVKQAIQKILTMKELHKAGVAVPEFTFDINTAKEWAKDAKVYCRTLTAAHEGKGIVVATKPEEVVRAPLYTKRFENGREYRIHVAFGNAIQCAQKKKRVGVEVNPLIRSNSGWVFAREIEPPPVCVTDNAVKAVKALGLDFGAVDVVYSVKKDKACVLEVNTAPGLDQTSATIYAKAFAQQLQQRKGNNIQ